MRQTLLGALALLISLYATASETGSQLFKKHCAVCHGHDAERRAWNVTDPIAGWPPELIKRALMGYKQKTRDIYGYGAYMHPQIDRYTPEEIDAIIAHIASLDRATSLLAAKQR